MLKTVTTLLQGHLSWEEKKMKSNEGTTQGDPASMEVYGIGVTPFINMLINLVIPSKENQVGVLAYANDISAAEKLDDLRKW